MCLWLLKTCPLCECVRSTERREYNVRSHLLVSTLSLPFSLSLSLSLSFSLSLFLSFPLSLSFSLSLSLSLSPYRLERFSLSWQRLDSTKTRQLCCGVTTAGSSVNMLSGANTQTSSLQHEHLSSSARPSYPNQPAPRLTPLSSTSTFIQPLSTLPALSLQVVFKGLRLFLFWKIRQHNGTSQHSLSIREIRPQERPADLRISHTQWVTPCARPSSATLSGCSSTTTPTLPTGRRRWALSFTVTMATMAPTWKASRTRTLSITRNTQTLWNNWVKCYMPGRNRITITEYNIG